MPEYVSKELKFRNLPSGCKPRLKAIGLHPINNVVDITNFILFELGQPLHSFDKDKIKGNKVIVRSFPTGTRFTTLDGVERELNENDLMVCNTEEPYVLPEYSVDWKAVSPKLRPMYSSKVPVSIRYSYGRQHVVMG